MKSAPRRHMLWRRQHQASQIVRWFVHHPVWGLWTRAFAKMRFSERTTRSLYGAYCYSLDSFSYSQDYLFVFIVRRIRDAGRDLDPMWPLWFTNCRGKLSKNVWYNLSPFFVTALVTFRTEVLQPTLIDCCSRYIRTRERRYQETFERVEMMKRLTITGIWVLPFRGNDCQVGAWLGNSEQHVGVGFIGFRDPQYLQRWCAVRFCRHFVIRVQVGRTEYAAVEKWWDDVYITLSILLLPAMSADTA